MSYEGKMLEKFDMPSRNEVKQAILKALFRHEGVIQEFSSDEKIVDEIASYFDLSREQREAYLETVYKKEDRVKRSNLWHRLLYRAADSLAKDSFISRPSKTIELTDKREWMLTENGFDKALDLLMIPIEYKDFLLTKSYEVQKVVKQLSETPRPRDYDPINKLKKRVKVTKKATLRSRGFRQAIIQAYDFKCAVCGLKIKSPNLSLWEVEAAHIVPNSFKGKDDVINGLALCHLHHWAFDVGWFTLDDDYVPEVSTRYESLPSNYGRIGNSNFIGLLDKRKKPIYLPKNKNIYPHQSSIQWHRQNIFYKN
jgi:putative restriction endonuclease